jgi:FMN-dependent oxidoreductase (nitrilotriacetate monooxygenase family)
MTNKKQLRLSAIPMSPAHAREGWRMPGAATDSIMNFGFYKQLAEQAESAKLDLLFIADKYTTSGSPQDADFHQSINGWPEPFTLLSALIGATSRIGLSVTASTTYWEPYHLARIFASLDHLSNGRASWNIVSSRGNLEEHNFSHMRSIPANKRQEHSEEFVQVVKALWDSWQADAVIADAVSGQYTQAGSVQEIRHEGAWFNVAGPLNVPRPPQGYPVLVQAGESSRFKESAAQGADLVFTTLPNLQQAKAFYTDLKSRMQRYGRRPEDLLLLPGLMVTVGDTEAEARDKDDLFQELVSGRNRMEFMSAAIGCDVRDHSPQHALPAPDEHSTEKYSAIYAEAARLGITTLAELQRYLSERSGHLKLVGTPVQIADQLQRWLEEQGADGFTFIPRQLPGGFAELCTLVVPELQNRGIFKTEYSEGTLREQLGLTNLIRSP